MIRATALLCLAALTGCAAQVTSSTPRSVIINAGKPPISTVAAQRIADAECSKHGRYARLAARPEDYRPEFVFDCVL